MKPLLLQPAALLMILTGTLGGLARSADTVSPAATPPQKHWAYQPVERPELPAVSSAEWIRMPLDAWVLEKLEVAGVEPSPEADRRTLIRRVTVGLTGLPPTPAEVDAFLNDSRPDAYARLVDRLLASPRYGERWGRHWLDVARYADTRGYSFGRERNFPYAYTYRDYVIRAFNDDLPFDQFVLEQLAADHLPLEERGRRQALAALGFLTVGRKFNNMHDDIDDQIDVVTRGLMGLTVACARCHDHKYDAIPTADYYSLYGVFASSEEPEELPLISEPEPSAEYQAFRQELDKLRQASADYRREKRQELMHAARGRSAEYLARVLSEQSEELLQKLPFISLSPDELRPQLIERWRHFLRQQAKPDHPVLGPLHDLARLDEAQFAAEAPALLEQSLQKEHTALNPLVRAALEAQPLSRKTDLALAYGQLFDRIYARWQQSQEAAKADASLTADEQQIADLLFGAASPTHIPENQIVDYLNRADRNAYRELERKVDAHEVHAPGAPPRAMVLQDRTDLYDPQIFVRGDHTRHGDPVPRQFLAVLSGDDRQPFQHGSGRLELARAIIDDQNPLTRRVIVNRIWMHHFGEPLVETTSDFGTRSEPPVHSALLDYLAYRLQQEDSSLKSIHRELVLSATYRQASVPRAECAEVDPQNRLWWRMLPRRLEWEAMHDSLLFVAGRLDVQMGGRPVGLLQTSNRRRAVYGLIDRQDLPNLLRVFDIASPDQSSAGRPRTTVPQQALFLLNSLLVIEQARALAARPGIAQCSETAERITALYDIVYQREPTAAEIVIGETFIADAAATAGDAQLSPWEQYAQLLLLSNEFMFVD